MYPYCIEVIDRTFQILRHGSVRYNLLRRWIDILGFTLLNRSIVNFTLNVCCFLWIIWLLNFNLLLVNWVLISISALTISNCSCIGSSCGSNSLFAWLISSSQWLWSLLRYIRLLWCQMCLDLIIVNIHFVVTSCLLLLILVLVLRDCSLISLLNVWWETSCTFLCITLHTTSYVFFLGGLVLSFILKLALIFSKSWFICLNWLVILLLLLLILTWAEMTQR